MNVEQLIAEIYNDNYSHIDFMDNMGGGDCDCRIHSALDLIVEYRDKGKKNLSEITDWVEDRQENGDDGAGHCDDSPGYCAYCQKEVTTEHHTFTVVPISGKG